MTTGILNIGSSALDAAYTALQTTGNNIANVNTPGYSREITTFTPDVQTNIGGMYLGNGVSVDGISRVYSDFLAQQTNLAQAQASQADSTAQLNGQINNLFSNSTTGLGAAMDAFFAQIQSLSSDPTSAATRQTALSAAQQMASQFNSAYAQLQSLSQSATQQISAQISTVNTTVSQIATLNSQIALASAGNQAPNSLLDQRNQDILTLNKAIGVTTTQQDDGSINVYLANGEPLVVGSQSYALASGLSPLNSQNVVVGTSVDGQIAAIDPNNSGGGAIGALLQFQNQTVPDVENQIGRLAVTLSTEFNAVQAAGIDQNGAQGAAFFSTPSIAVSAATTNSDANTVTLNASYSNVTALQASNYTLSVSNGTYTLTRLSDGTTTTLSAFPATVDGMTLSFSGTPANGDVFNISPVQQGANNLSVSISQGSQIAAGNPLQATLGSNNSGSLAVSNLALQPLSLPINANLLHAVSLNFTSPTSYTYTTGGVTSAAQTYTAGQAIDINGWSLTLTGTPANGDVVNVTASGSGSGDNRNALLMTQLQQQNLVAGSTLDAAYASTVADVGTLAATANTNQTSQDAILQNATTAQSSVSGVNLNEEATNLMQYQQQYQAAAQLIQSADTVFSTLITVLDAVT
jgi:flagellar hook-associated protein 1 FlgK